MSCPYLEKGITAYCHAFGDKRLAVESPEIEDFCFSGEFSECSFLFVPPSIQYKKNMGERNSSSGPLKTCSNGSRISTKGTPIG